MPFVSGREGDPLRVGPRTLMVTLLGVRSFGEINVCPPTRFEELPPRVGVNGDGEFSSADGAVVMRSADMLRCVRAPLSKRGRFRVTLESASSIGFRRGGLGPAEVARVSVDGGPGGTDSITLLSRDNYEGEE